MQNHWPIYQKKLSQRENRNEILCKLKALPEIERLFFAWHIIKFGWHEYGHITDEEKKLFQFFPLIKKNLLQFHGHHGFVTNISDYSIDPTAMKIIKNNQYLIPEIK